MAEEQAVGLVYNTIPYADMMATASDLEHLAIGFSVTEGIVPNIAAVRSVEIGASTDTQDGVEARVWIRGNEFSSLMRARRRSMVGRVSCGLCGVESLDDAVRPGVAVREGRAVSISAPTGLALRRAQEAGLTPVAHARADTQTVYTHPWRIEADVGVP